MYHTGGRGGWWARWMVGAYKEQDFEPEVYGFVCGYDSGNRRILSSPLHDSFKIQHAASKTLKDQLSVKCKNAKSMQFKHDCHGFFLAQPE